MTEKSEGNGDPGYKSANGSDLSTEDVEVEELELELKLERDNRTDLYCSALHVKC